MAQLLAQTGGRRPTARCLPALAAAWALVSACVPMAACGLAWLQPKPAQHAILITVDTWRGDHFHAERAGVALTPALERFAASGLAFTQAHSVGSETSPGAAGILTGLLPWRSGVVVNSHTLPPEVPSLATHLQEEGFATAAVISNPVLEPGMGFEQGFDHYEMVPHPGQPKPAADSVTDAALARWDAWGTPDGSSREGDAPDGERRFLWVHYLDPHGPYVPPPEIARRFPADAFEAPRDVPLQPEGRQSGRGAIPSYQQVSLDGAPVSRDARDYLARYAAEVRFMDGEVGRLLEGLAARGALDRAVVVITADHGEALAGDHGYFFSHGNSLTQDQLHVPLILRCPGCPAGETVDRPVSNVDVVPTVLARLGLDPPEDLVLDGVDLLDREERLVFGQSAQEMALRQGSWKLRWHPQRGPLLYRLTDDPARRPNLAATHPERLRDFQAAIEELRALPVVGRPRAREIPEDVREQLRALGYL